MSWTHTTVAANTFMVIAFAATNDVVSTFTATVDSNAATLVNAYNYTSDFYVVSFIYVAPASGAHTVEVVSNVTQDFEGGSVAYTGVGGYASPTLLTGDNTSMVGTFPSTSSNNIVFGCCATSSGEFNSRPATSRFWLDLPADMAASDTPGTGSNVTLTWGASSELTYGIIGFELQAPTGIFQNPQQHRTRYWTRHQQLPAVQADQWFISSRGAAVQQPRLGRGQIKRFQQYTAPIPVAANVTVNLPVAQIVFAANNPAPTVEPNLSAAAFTIAVYTLGFKHGLQTTNIEFAAYTLTVHAGATVSLQKAAMTFAAYTFTPKISAPLLKAAFTVAAYALTPKVTPTLQKAAFTVGAYPLTVPLQIGPAQINVTAYPVTPHVTVSLPVALCLLPSRRTRSPRRSFIRVSRSRRTH
jgi:hypothetical protein